MVFGTIPTFPMENAHIPSQKERMDALNKASYEIAKFKAEQRITAAKSFNNPPSAIYECKIGDKVHAYSEAKTKWIQNFRIVHLDGKMALINNGQRVMRLKTAQFLPKLNDEELSEIMK